MPGPFHFRRLPPYRILIFITTSFICSVTLLSLLLPSNEDLPEIDVVYTWVNGSDPEHLAARRALGEKPSQENRHRDLQELKYSLRALEKNCKWVRNIYLVVYPGQAPTWLRRDHPRLKVIGHDQIFTNSSDLPSFNSNAIETHLHRIPNLSEDFLYFNDDFFVTLPASKSHFITPDGGPWVYLDGVFSPDGVRLHQRGKLKTDLVPYQASFVNSNSLLDKRFGYESRQVLRHIPYLVNKKLYSHVQNIFKKQYQETSTHKFRSHKDIEPLFLYYHYLLNTENSGAMDVTSLWSSLNTQYVSLCENVSYVRTAFLRAIFWRPVFLCINDDLDTTDHPVVSLLHYFLVYLFPHPSSFEK
eukprot:TRINITY_DN13213_c0_g1_i1.p1 TRINITY_DN13213_c0_g1~~TRINITY_DN13213_c0_g1_i1.p1  ORF type:complete len:358 (+),score=44.52 TRINITY_DN13213_c0_g1_i1:29-1102(+)